MYHHDRMPSIDLRELCARGNLKLLLGEGKTVDLREGHRLIALIVPAQRRLPKQWPDFAHRRRGLFGKRILPGAELVIGERGRY